MTVFMHMLYQLMLLIGQGINLFGGVIPPKYQPVVAFVLGLSQLGLALYNHYYNPDGTPASVSYIAKLLLLCLLASGVALAQTPAPTPLPAPTTSTASFNIGAQAFGLGGSSQATPASDVTLSLNPGFSTNKYLKTLELRSDNLLAPGANLQYYGGGVNWVTPLKFASTSAFAPLSFYVDATAGVGRIVPASGATVSHVGFMAGGGLRWLTGSGVQLTLIEVNVLHTPGAPWGSSAPAVSGGLSYVFGHQ